MAVNSLEFKSNQYCNKCFNERAETKHPKDEILNTFHFMGENFSLEDKRKQFK